MLLRYLTSMIKPLLTRYALALFAVALFGSCSRPDAYDYQRPDYTATASVEEQAPKTAAELRAELLLREQAAPVDYLQVVQGSFHRNLIDQLVLEGDIANTATLARFKDPVLSVTWYSKTHTKLATKEYAVYELMRAQGTTHFKFKTDAPADVATVSMRISGAVVVE